MLLSLHCSAAFEAFQALAAKGKTCLEEVKFAVHCVTETDSCEQSEKKISPIAQTSEA